MNAPAPTLTATVRITRIRFRKSNVSIFFGHRVDLNTGVNDRSHTLVVRVPSSVIKPENFDVGEIWEVSGTASTYKHKHGTYVTEETQIEASDCQLVRPSGSQIIEWIALNEKISGIHRVKATKLWDAHTEGRFDLYDVLDNADHDAIAAIIPSEHIRAGLFETWAQDGDADTLRFVQERGMPLDLARKAIRFHKKRTVEKLTEDPYRLLSFTGDWKVVDELARRQFGVARDDNRRLSAALEEALYRALNTGHTCQSFNRLYTSSRTIMHPFPQPKAALEKALVHGEKSGQFIVNRHETPPMLHVAGTWVMEKAVAQYIKGLLESAETEQGNLLQADLDEIIHDFEHSEQQLLGNPEFALNDAQVNAVKTSFSNRFSIITGGAGVGKTTVLKALYKALDALGKPRFQMALSGRAAARMIDATHEPAMTIASFLRNVTANELGEHPIIIIDEASMLDLTTFYRLTRKLPADTHLILVGDPYQLPPIGAGLILHLLCNMPTIPSTELTVVKRQAADSDIPAISKSIRDGIWPTLPKAVEGSDVAFISCDDQQITPTVMKLYDQDRDSTQILCATKSCRFAGVQNINEICHSKYVATGTELMLKNEYTDELEFTGFCTGDLLLYTANDWFRNLQNGCLGELTEVFDEPRNVNLGSEDKPTMRTALGRAVFEGVEHYVLDTDVDVIEHAYAITVHKSQGSQFERVIVPIRKSRVLDRTFVYTAVTRAKRQVILVGDEQAARAAVEAIPRAFKRQVGLQSMLMQ